MYGALTVPLHVVYVTEEDERGEAIAFLRESLTDPIVWLVIGLAVLFLGILVGLYLRWQPLRQDITVFRETLISYRDLLPWLLRLGFGLPLVGAGFAGYWFNPVVEPFLPSGVARLVGIALGFAILFGIATRVAALITGLLYLISLPLAPALLWSFEWLPGALVIALLGSGRPSADQVLHQVASTEGTVYGMFDPVHRIAPRVRRMLAPARRFVPTVLRVGLGATFIGLGVAEKLLAPAMAADVVDQYGLQQVIPISTEAWIVAAGISEVAIGVILLVGLFTRFAALAALGMFVLTLFAIPDDPVLAHIGIFAMCSALLITGSGPWALDNRLGPRDPAGDSPLS